MCSRSRSSTALDVTRYPPTDVPFVRHLGAQRAFGNVRTVCCRDSVRSVLTQLLTDASLPSTG
eukprot:12625428-Prorocentrum_lima.AAC.1